MRGLRLGAAIACIVFVFSGRLCAAIVDLPDITVTSFEHGYTPATHDDPFGGIADGVSFRGDMGTFSTTPFVGQFQNGDIIQEHVVAPPGYQFFVDADPQLPGQVVGMEVDWQTTNGDGIGTTQSVNVSYDNSQGATPTPVYGSQGVGDGGELASWYFYSPVSGDFTFTGITLQMIVQNSPPAGTHTFTLTSVSDPAFYSNGFGFNPSDLTLLGLTPIVPEPAGLAAVMLCLGAAARRRAR